MENDPGRGQGGAGCFIGQTNEASLVGLSRDPSDVKKSAMQRFGGRAARLQTPK